jgi:hypothetical protein
LGLSVQKTGWGPKAQLIRVIVVDPIQLRVSHKPWRWPLGLKKKNGQPRGVDEKVVSKEGVW